jgi:hypothetical protein
MDMKRSALSIGLIVDMGFVIVGVIRLIMFMFMLMIVLILTVCIGMIMGFFLCMGMIIVGVILSCPARTHQGQVG